MLEPIEDTVLTDGATSLQVAAGTPVYVLLTHGSEDDADRFPDPATFRPERWLTGNAPLPAAAQPYLPFGNGPRFCPGRNLALMEATLLAAMTCQAFTIEPDMTAGPVGERVTFALFPKDLAVRMRPLPA